MYKKALMAIVVLAMVSMMFAPAFAWDYPNGDSDIKVETWGPHADSLLIKMYASETSEWETGLEGGEIDVTDWPLDHTHLERYTTLPWSDEINVLGYGAEFGIQLFDLNNNNNTYLGNPPDPACPNPRYPNPMGYTVDQSNVLHDGGYPLRHAIAHLVNRDAVVSYVGTEAAVAVYTPVVPSYGKYMDVELAPGGLREELTHPYDPSVAEDILTDAEVFPIGGDGWRYWDRNRNGVYDGGTEYLELKIIARVDHAPRDYMGTQLGLELTAQHIHVNVQHITITAARIQWMTNKDAHIYTAGWSLGSTPDSLVLWHWAYYWHPGRPYNTAGCNKDAFNNAADGVQYANTQDDAVYNAIVAQQVFADAVLSVTVYASSGFKAVSRTYVGDEVGYTGDDWYGFVNWPGYGVDNFYTFLNMHTASQKFGGRIRYGFKTVDLRQMNPIYTEWLWDNTVIDLVGYDSLVARDPYTMNFVPWVSKTFQLGTYNHPTYGTCTKVAFTLRNDVYFQDGTQLTVADIAFTFIEIDDLLAGRGLAPPWWISNVQNILSFSVLDPLNFEVLLDVKSIFALGWIGGNRILPKHIWKPIVTGVVAPKSGVAWDPTTFAPDPNLVGSGPWRFDEYVSSSHVLLVANTPGSVVDTGIITDPNANSVPTTSTKGYFRLKPKYVNIHADNYRAKILCTESVPPCNPQKWMWVELTATDHNLWLEEFEFLQTGEDLELIWPEAHGCIWHILEHIGLDMLRVVPVNPPGPPGANIVLHIEYVKPGNILHCGQVIEAVKTVYVDGNLIAGPTAEYEKPCIPIVETFPVNLTKCFHTATLSKEITTEWFLTPANTLVPNPYTGPIEVTWPIWVTIKEDITGSYYINTQLLAPDCKVDLKDVFLAGKAFGSVPGDDKWSAVADINLDYKIDLKDYFAIAKKFGKW